ncbi:18877_t:CDS:2 [Gigaspora margarita]|uniref:18877_t:CDS:1 n=1 Tax=Gigaspora margarita TaxID=4874 RepID=A0ABN7VIA7_GIGMA|nr:18877_t:CDS:2 [Gigaspora margarita]
MRPNILVENLNTNNNNNRYYYCNVLKEKQKYEKKGTRKRITKKVRTILEEYFLASNANKSVHYNIQDMHQALQKKGEIENKDVSKISTIQN